MDTLQLERQVQTLKALAHPIRLRLLEALACEEECVCHLSAVIGRPQPYVSQQLAALRDRGLVADRRDGQRVFYRLSGPGLADLLRAARAASGREASPPRASPEGCPCPKCA